MTIVDKPSVDFLKQALSEASINALRVALYHETDDPDLSEMPVIQRGSRGGALMSYAVDKSYHDIIRGKALNYLQSGHSPKQAPDKIRTAQLIETFTGTTPSKSELDFGYEELGFEAFPRLARWKDKSPKNIDDYNVAIIGSGFSGLAAAVQLEQLGIPYQIFERHPDIGGTWFVNDYPEARVDVSTFLYQFKFEKNYPWESYYAGQAELKRYINHIVDKYDIRSKISLSHSLEKASWDDKTSRWNLNFQTADGQSISAQSRFVISATGLFRTPKLPDIPGIETYTGKMFHTTNWDHNWDYSGKKMAVIGTGSTGSQLVPALANSAATLTVYQRTANWVTPVKGYKSSVSKEKRWLLDNMPGYASWYNFASYIAEIPAQNLQVVDSEWTAKGGRVNAKNAELAQSLKAYIRYKIGDDDELFEKLVPKHPPLARRLVIDNGWYDALVKETVELVSGSIGQITKTGIIGSDGIHRECDGIVLGAGFEVSEFLYPVEYIGRDGVTLETLWKKDGGRAYKGMTLPHFPNFFMFYGPNAQARAGSFHSWVEILSRYIASLIVETIEQEAASVEVKNDAYLSYNKDMDAALESILWQSEGMGGYYLNKHGRSHINMPWSLHEFFQMVKTADVSAYKFQKNIHKSICDN